MAKTAAAGDDVCPRGDQRSIYRQLIQVEQMRKSATTAGLLLLLGRHPHKDTELLYVYQFLL